MSLIQFYECPKCKNRLLYSNKMLHDLKCTKERPAIFSLQNPIIRDNYYNEIKYQNQNYQLDNYSKFRSKSNSPLSKGMKIKNDDGTTIEIKKDINIYKKEELFEITYDPQGNIIGRKKAFGGKNKVKYKFHDMLDYKKNDISHNYYIYEGNNFYDKN